MALLVMTSRYDLRPVLDCENMVGEGVMDGAPPGRVSLLGTGLVMVSRCGVGRLCWAREVSERASRKQTAAVSFILMQERKLIRLSIDKEKIISRLAGNRLIKKYNWLEIESR